MSKVTAYLVYHLMAFGGYLWLIAIIVFLFAYYLLYCRRNYQTAIEMTCIAWLLTLCGVSMAFVASFRTMGYIPKWWEVQLMQYWAFASILVIPILLTIPIVWTCCEPNSTRSIAKSRLLIVAVLVAFFDVLIYLALFVPMWGWSFDPPDLEVMWSSCFVRTLG